MVQHWVIALSAISKYFSMKKFYDFSYKNSVTLLPPLACQGVFKVWNSGHQITE